MTASPLADLEVPPLDRTTEELVYRQQYHRACTAALDDTFTEVKRLPSVRSLASQLGLARGTVEAADDQLAGEGYIIGCAAAGTFVTEVAAVPGSATAVVTPIASQP